MLGYINASRVCQIAKQLTLQCVHWGKLLTLNLLIQVNTCLRYCFTRRNNSIVYAMDIRGLLNDCHFQHSETYN